MKIQEVLEKTTTFFKAKQMDSPRLDAELLISASLGIKRIDLYLKFDQPLKEDELEKCREFVRRRSQGEPVAYILNQKHFYGYEFFVDHRVLIPRPETELLVERAFDEIKKLSHAPKILDLGAGSGCIGLTILKRNPGAQAVLVDADSGPIEVIKINAERLEVSDRLQVLHTRVQDLPSHLDHLKASGGGDFSTDSSKFDLVLANPPYIGREDLNIDANVKKFEPDSALFAEDQGLAEIKSWLPIAVESASQGGAIIFEIGWKQGPQVKELFEQVGLQEVKVHRDLSENDRFVFGRKQELHG